MRAFGKSFPLLVAFVLLSQASPSQADVRRAGIAGRVVGEASPLSAAQIYAYELADFSLHKVLTDAQGNFLFQNLPAGLYQIIAHKAGFLPLVVMLTHTTAQPYTFLDLKLSQRQAGTKKDDEDFWAVRARVPPDVLRDIEISQARAGDVQVTSFTGIAAGSFASSLRAEMQALTGVDGIAGGQLSGGGVGVKGYLGDTLVDLKGRYMQLTPDPFQSAGSPANTGQTSSLSLDLDRGHGSRINISSFNNRMGRSESGGGPVDFEHYQVNWSQQVGENGHSEFAAHYTAEDNFHRQAPIDPLGIPETSRSWRIEGAYTESFSDSSSLQTGLRYRERQFGFGDDPSRQGKAAERQALSSVDLFSRGGVRVEPAVLMEYGLYSTLSDGSLALTPQGGVVLQLGSNWQLESTAARRVYTTAQANPDFLPTLFEQRDLCEQGSDACYQMNLSRKEGDDNTFTFGAVHRRVGDTLRLYFSDDFFDRLESLYLVRGDKLPEVHVAMRHKLSPKVVTKVESSLASGGGGVFLAADGLPYENQVRYLVASVDTQFLATSTGVFVAFHRLQQQLDPAFGTTASHASAQMEYQRLQLMLSQNLNVLLNLASDWAVQLNMELSRGGTLAGDAGSDTAIHRRILGGIAVKF
ncbi:MAG TPA: carboxypeptidase-like regulatory domain-containing protein [Thermoanaerobaculia bacterium]|nr:carboxypeptidase-like regulatory domain-containing protein [Thermoanaerobaculia bacterium]